MSRLGTLAWAAVLGALQSCAAPVVETTPVQAPARVGVRGFSVEAPSSPEWQLRKTDSTLTFDRGWGRWGQLRGTICICISRHALPPLSGELLEEELANLFLEGERRFLDESGRGEDTCALSRNDFVRGAKRLYQLTYDLHSRSRSEDPAWGNGFWHRQGEIDVYFPQGIRGEYFYCFEIRVIHHAGWNAEPGELQLMEAVIESFREECVVPRVEPPGVRSR